MKRLIVNADDFGLHPSVNKAVLQAYHHGCLRSTSFMSVGRAAEEAAELARREPGLSTGLHLTMVAERPVSPVAQVSSLVDETGHFWPDYGVFIKRWVAGKIKPQEVALECEAQLVRMEELGLKISHFDSHQHLHVLPGINQICLAAMQRHGIKKMRRPRENYFYFGGLPFAPGRFIGRGGLSFLSELAGVWAQRRGIAMPDHFFGMLAGGQINGDLFRNFLRALPEGTSEIMIHPGADRKALAAVYSWGYSWEGELAAMTEPQTLRLMNKLGITSISYWDL